jgi:two-component system, sensor histidine kinase PdtaS
VTIHSLLHPEGPLSLALAVVASSSTPLLLLDGDLKVIAGSVSFCRTFDIDPGKLVTRTLTEVGGGEWDVPQLMSLLTATAAGFAQIEAYEMDLKRQGLPVRRLVLNAQKLAYDGSNGARVLLSVTDVTEARNAARAHDALLREKAVLMQEVQHRVANSLQIIASVLMQSARKVQSEETRFHLKDAHSRVMSIASVQKQLASSHLGEVAINAYFGQLCQSLGASMIEDHARLSIEVHADTTVTSADESVSLGLIVTELVINALKHAFPDQRKGTIVVSYKANAPDWTLSIADDGIGMPALPGVAKPGLGTNIVEALARQLEARVEVTSRNPGTLVSIVKSSAPGKQPDEPPSEAV